MTPKTIIFLSIVIRVVLIYWLSVYQSPQHLTLTDIDYKVYSQASEHLLSGNSPYSRHTYRYTPLLASLMSLNKYHFSLGKYIFAFFDLLCLLLINRMFKGSAAIAPLMCYGLNPIMVYLTVRGSCESISCCLMFLMVWLEGRVFWAAVVYGFWVHMRVYPVVFVGVVLGYFGGRDPARWAKVILGGVIGFLPIVGYYYSQYGYEFLQESYLYHLTRVDNRHNLSGYWYWIYLSMNDPSNPTQQLLKSLPFIYLLFKITKTYYQNLRLSLFLLTYIFVLFNKVLTVQYYMWIFASLCLVVNSLAYVMLGKWRAMVHMFAVWLLGVLVWVWAADKIQGQGQNMFGFMWVVCLARMAAETWLLIRIVSMMEPNTLKRENMLKERVKIGEAKELTGAKQE